MKKIRAILFDLGGVVLTQSARVRAETIAEVLNVSVKDLEKAMKKYNVAWSTGKLSIETLAKRLKQEFKIKTSISKILKIWKETYERKTTPNTVLINIIDRLKRSYKIYLLTNTVDLHHSINSKRNIFNHFDRVFASLEIGKRKPDLDFYEHALKEVNLKSSECIFTDDLKENVKAAKKLGFKIILFKNNEDFVQKLNKTGIKI